MFGSMIDDPARLASCWDYSSGNVFTNSGLLVSLLPPDPNRVAIIWSLATPSGCQLIPGVPNGGAGPLNFFANTAYLQMTFRDLGGIVQQAWGGIAGAPGSTFRWQTISYHPERATLSTFAPTGE